MPYSNLLDSIPIWAIYPLALLIFLAVLELGYLAAKKQRQRTPDISDPGLGGLVGSTFALLAFLLGFVVAFGTNIYNERRQMVMRDANAITTAYLRAGTQADPYRTQSRALLSEAVDQRLLAVEKAADPAAVVAAANRVTQINYELWSIGETIAKEAATSTTPVYLTSLNDMISVFSERVNAALQMRTPPALTMFLFAVALLTLFLIGLQSGHAPRRNPAPLIVLALILSLVFYLIVDLDRPQQGLVRVPEQPLHNVQRQLSQMP